MKLKKIALKPTAKPSPKTFHIVEEPRNQAEREKLEADKKALINLIATIEAFVYNVDKVGDYKAKKQQEKDREVAKYRKHQEDYFNAHTAARAWAPRAAKMLAIGAGGYFILPAGIDLAGLCLGVGGAATGAFAFMNALTPLPKGEAPLVYEWRETPLDNYAETSPIPEVIHGKGLRIQRLAEARGVDLKVIVDSFEAVKPVKELADPFLVARLGQVECVLDVWG